MTTDDLILFVAKGQRAQAAADEATRQATEGKRFADAQHPAGYPPDHDKPRWFITFLNNDPERAGCYSLLRSQDYGDARREAFNRFGPRWGFMYGVEDLEQQRRDYGIREWKE